MNNLDLAHLVSHVNQLRKAQRRERWLYLLLMALMLGAVSVGMFEPGMALAAPKRNNLDHDGVLHVRGLVVKIRTVTSVFA